MTFKKSRPQTIHDRLEVKARKLTDEHADETGANMPFAGDYVFLTCLTALQEQIEEQQVRIELLEAMVMEIDNMKITLQEMST